MVNMLHFAGHMLSVAATQLCRCSSKAGINNVLAQAVAVF